jgi:hypothetical protein
MRIWGIKIGIILVLNCKRYFVTSDIVKMKIENIACMVVDIVGRKVDVTKCKCTYVYLYPLYADKFLCFISSQHLTYWYAAIK